MVRSEESIGDPALLTWLQERALMPMLDSALPPGVPDMLFVHVRRGRLAGDGVSLVGQLAVTVDDSKAAPV